YKSVAVNLSDIYAMNGVAEHITVGIAVSNRFPVEALEEIYEGIHLACERYNVDLVGGDTTASQSGLMISVTATGRVEKGTEAKRSGAGDNDLIVVSGDVGGAYMGL
ncbi:MAG TPA: thiamine-phosphate kinase, partial [Cryomorphaceae bacterium]|nr:thiamine-phosphate kinase [Cryomorphaceae bacterium]